MTIVKGLHGRARMRRAALSRFWLAALLVIVPIGLRALEVDVFYFVRVATAGGIANAATRWIYELESAIACAGYLVAGMAFDRFGLKRGFALVILAWSATVPLATVVDPLAYRALSPVLTAMLPGFVVTALLLAVRLAWPARRRGLAIMALLLVYEHLRGNGLIHLDFATASRDVSLSWQVPILVSATIGAGLFALWLVGLREVEPHNGLDLRAPPASSDAWQRIFSDNGLWTILVIEVCETAIWHFSQGLRWEIEPLRKDAPATIVFIINWAAPTAALVTVAVSDRIYRQRRNWTAARQAPLIAAFAVAGIAPVLGAMAVQSGPALQIIDFVAIGASRVVTLVLLDLVPRHSAGRAIGFVVAGESLAQLYLFPELTRLGQALGSVVPVIAASACIGIVLVARMLPRLRPAEP